LVNRLTSSGFRCRCWYRPDSDRGGFDYPDFIDWIPGELGSPEGNAALCDTVDAIVHAGLYRPGRRFRGGEGDVTKFAQLNIVGTIQLVEAARSAGVSRFVFISTCAVHEEILNDRPLDEAHPLWPTSHYGAHKAAIEKFVHSYGLGDGYEICSLRPTGIYGIARPMTASKWYDLVHQVARGEPVDSPKGGKEVHAIDVARAVEILLTAPNVAGQVYNCYDQYISEQSVAEIARKLVNSSSTIVPHNRSPKNQIDTFKIKSLGMSFGGTALLTETVRELLSSAPWK
jgi:nucleoside-diphosphate-sugar epimerase